MYKKRLTLLVLCFTSLFAWAQNISVTGTVIDQASEPIIGASVVSSMVQGTGTITDLDGVFTLNVPKGDVLTISYIGYTTQKVTVTGSEIKVVLEEDSHNLNDVVVVGYGTQKKANLTGSVAAVDSKDLNGRAITNVTTGLQGKMAGVTIKNTTGRPGVDDGDNSIRVRGTGTMNNAAPMIVVDGIESTMYDLDPNDIESVSVLKDAASAAIYGSKAANGVVVITTKRGATGKAKISYNGTFGWQSPTNIAKYCNSAEYARLYNEANIGEGREAVYSAEDITLFENGQDPDGHPNTNWQDLMFDRSGFQQTHNLSLSGGTEANRYMVSLGYTDQDGIIRKSGKEKYNIRMNLDNDFTERLSGAFNMSYSREDITTPAGPNNNAYDYFFYILSSISPMVANKYSSGDYGYIGDGNPIAWLDLGSTSDKIRNNLTTSGSLTYTILPGLTAKVMASYKLYYQENHDKHDAVAYNPNYTHGTIDKLTENIDRNDRATGDILLDYTKTFNNAHNLHVMGGYHTEYFRSFYMNGYRENFPSKDLYDLNAAGTKNQSTSGYRRELSMISYFGRVNYDYKGRYLFEANVRYDGTSRFAAGNRWGAFPSVSAGWRLSDEAFFEPLTNIISNAKLRASWGMLGNQDIAGYYPTVSTFSLGQDYPFGGSIAPGAVTTNAVNKELKWEATTTWGIGLDMDLFGKVNIVADYYNKTTDGILMTINTPVTFALNNFYDNVGKVRNQGFELAVSYHDRIGEVRFNVGGNITINKNEILGLGESGDTYIYDTNGACYGIMREGSPLNSFFGYKTDGYFQNEAEIAAAYPKGWTQLSGKDPKPGDIKYVDINGDGKLDADDRTVLGSWDPELTFGFNLGADWKGFDIMMAFQGAAKVNGYLTREGIGYLNGDASKPTKIWLDHWTESNPNAKTPRLITGMEGWSMPTTTSDFWMQNTAYLRMKTLQVGYTLPKFSWFDKAGISNIRLYYTGENLFTITGMLDGYDPEAPVTADNMKGNYYPQTKINSIGISLTF